MVGHSSHFAVPSGKSAGGAILEDVLLIGDHVEIFIGTEEISLLMKRSFIGHNIGSLKGRIQGLGLAHATTDVARRRKFKGERPLTRIQKATRVEGTSTPVSFVMVFISFGSWVLILYGGLFNLLFEQMTKSMSMESSHYNTMRSTVMVHR